MKEVEIPREEVGATDRRTERGRERDGGTVTRGRRVIDHHSLISDLMKLR